MSYLDRANGSRGILLTWDRYDSIRALSASRLQEYFTIPFSARLAEMRSASQGAAGIRSSRSRTVIIRSRSSDVSRRTGVSSSHMLIAQSAPSIEYSFAGPGPSPQGAGVLNVRIGHAPERFRTRVTSVPRPTDDTWGGGQATSTAELPLVLSPEGQQPARPSRPLDADRTDVRSRATVFAGRAFSGSRDRFDRHLATVFGNELIAEHAVSMPATRAFQREAVIKFLKVAEGARRSMCGHHDRERAT